MKDEFAANSQDLKGEIIFYPTDVKTRKDEKYGNRYAVWNVKLAPEEKKAFEMIFEMDVSPASGSDENPAYAFNGYEKISEDVKKRFCSSNKYISVEDKQIMAFAKVIKAGSDNVLEVMRRLNDFVIAYLDYGNPVTGLYTTLEALGKKHVDCGGFSTLFTSLAIAMGVPCRVVSGFWAGYKESSMHAWAEFMLPDGNWVAADPSVEQLFQRGQTVKSGNFGFVGSDRIAFSVGCDIPVVVDGKKVFVDILQNPHIYPKESAEGVKVEVKCRASKRKL